jgi:leucyl/phenylalanyl-tRNA---protein transferase
VRLGPWQPVNLMVTLAEESRDPATVADEAILRLRGLAALDAQTLIAQYIDGVVPFGYYGAGELYYWRRIDERGLITRETAKVPSGARRRLAKHSFDIRYDTDCDEIIERCRRVDGTWLNDRMVRALRDGLRHGVVTTIGAYDDGQLVGGEFGLYLHGWYCSMSTFHVAPNAGNALLVRVVNEILNGGRFVACDVGEMKPHSVQFGAVPVHLDVFARHLLGHLGQGVRRVYRTTEGSDDASPVSSSEEDPVTTPTSLH